MPSSCSSCQNTTNPSRLALVPDQNPPARRAMATLQMRRRWSGSVGVVAVSGEVVRGTGGASAGGQNDVVMQDRSHR